jgi:CRP-like cAMP-binding protein
MAAKPKTVQRHDNTLAGVELFRDLSPEDLQALSQRCQWRNYRAHQPIVRCQDDSRNVIFVIRGKVRATWFSRAGREVSFRDLGAGTIFGELSAIDGQPRSADVVALADTLVAAMPASVFWDVLRQYESVAAATLRGLVGLVRLLTDRVIEFSTLPVPHRIQAELGRIARQHAPGRKTAVIFPALTHSEIASRVSTNREAVTRELGELARASLLERRGSTLIVPDVDALATHVAKILGT